MNKALTGLVLLLVLAACTIDSDSPQDRADSETPSASDAGQSPEPEPAENNATESTADTNANTPADRASDGVATAVDESSMFTRITEPLARPAYTGPDTSVPLGLLPEGVTPLSYALALTVIPRQEQFSGHVDIAVRLDADADFIFLHGKGLNVTRVVVVLPSGKRIAATYSEVHEDGVARVDFERPVEAGTVLLEFDYTAAFGQRLHGLYKVTSDDAEYAFTQLESVYAREMFPSFDEPAFKTPFEVVLAVNPEHEAVANMPAVSSSVTGELKRVRFAPSPPMPTYLFAIAVGPFDIVEGEPIPANEVREEALPFRGIAVRGQGDRMTYAMKETGAILEAMEAYFGSAYPYAKLDIIAVPDFEAGAMENIGAITFRDKLLLLDEESPPQQKRAYASIMAHELAHMWFGNLVTIPWWDDLWLKESFATWMSYKAVAAYDPGHKPHIAQLRLTGAAMLEDSLNAARQIREPVLTNDDIVAAFDGITYSKGGAVLSMFEHYLGEERFQAGVREHILRYRQGSANVHDLVHSLSVAAGKDLAPAARSFLFQNGVPLIEAQTDCERDTIAMSQSRFVPIGSAADAKRTWQIPVCLKLGRNDTTEQACVMMTESKQEVALGGECPDWIMPNADFAGYFHWLVPPSAYETLLQAGDRLNEKEWLSVADSVQSGFASGHLDVETTWRAIEGLAASPFPSVARSMFSTIRYMEEALADNPKLRWTIRGRAASLYESLEAYRAFDRQFLKALPDNDTRIHFSNVASFMAETAYHQPTRSAALEKARAFIEDDETADTVSRATLDTILTVGVQDGGQAFVDALYQRFLASTDSWFRDTALSALARSRDPQFGQKLRDSALGDTLRTNEIRRLFVSHLREDVNLWPAWEWLKTNVDELVAVMPARHVPRLAIVAERICDQQYLAEIDKVLRPRLSGVPSGERRLDAALERMTVCDASVGTHRPQARAFFNQGVLRR